MDWSNNLTGMLESANVGVWQLHVPSGVVTRNDVFQRLIQVSPEELAGGLGAWAMRIHPADRQAVLEKRQRLLAGKLDAYTVVYRVRRARGGWVSLRNHVAVTERDAAGQPLWVSGLLIDISTERERERRLYAAFDRRIHFIGLLTVAGLVLETNRSTLLGSGGKSAALLGKALWEAAAFTGSPSLQAQLREGIAQAARGELARFELCSVSPDGGARTIDFTLTPVHDDDGNVVNIIPEGRDISELARTREALRATEQRLNTAIQAANIGLWDIDVPSGRLWMSPEFASTLGYRPEELSTLCDAVQLLLNPEDRAGVLQIITAQQCADSAGSFELERNVRCKDGTSRWIHSKGRCVNRAPDGQILRQAGISMDITARKETELRLAAAERLESIGRLAAGVAHEINTPIQYISDSVHFIREGVQELLAHVARLQGAAPPADLSPTDLPYLLEHLPAAVDRAIDGLGRVAEIVRSMKEYSHSDQGAMCPVDLNRAINSTLVVARGEYKYVADLETQFGDLPPVTCHGNRISQVILNLVVNAAHAIADKVAGTRQRGLITVKTSVDGHEVVISISDTGAGIPESVRPRVFEAFFTTKAVGRGTGQGLAIAHNVVQGHGGGICFQTAADQGTTFFVRLPIEQNAKPAAAVAA